jgi:hypothetical protein
MPPPGGFFMPFSMPRQRNFIANCMKYSLSPRKFQPEIATVLASSSRYPLINHQYRLTDCSQFNQLCAKATTASNSRIAVQPASEMSSARLIDFISIVMKFKDF